VATKLALKGLWKGVLSRISSKGGGSEEGLGMGYVQASGEQASTELRSLIRSCNVISNRARNTFSDVAAEWQ